MNETVERVFIAGRKEDTMDSCTCTCDCDVCLCYCECPLALVMQGSAVPGTDLMDSQSYQDLYWTAYDEHWS